MKIGSFKIPDVKTGEYWLKVSFLGYRERVIRDVKLTLKNPDFDCGRIFLAPDQVILDEVEITEEATLIENKVDRIVYNAEKDLNLARW